MHLKIWEKSTNHCRQLQLLHRKHSLWQAILITIGVLPVLVCYCLVAIMAMTLFVSVSKFDFCWCFSGYKGFLSIGFQFRSWPGNSKLVPCSGQSESEEVIKYLSRNLWLFKQCPLEMACCGIDESCQYMSQIPQTWWSTSGVEPPLWFFHVPHKCFDCHKHNNQ